MTLDEYQNAARRTQNTKLTSDQMTFHAITGMASEVGEIHSLFQHSVQESKPVDKAKLIDEIGDLLWFVCELCDAYDWSLDGIAECNRQKLIARYPDGFDAERSANRHNI